LLRRPPCPTRFPYTTLFRSDVRLRAPGPGHRRRGERHRLAEVLRGFQQAGPVARGGGGRRPGLLPVVVGAQGRRPGRRRVCDLGGVRHRGERPRRRGLPARTAQRPHARGPSPGDRRRGARRDRQGDGMTMRRDGRKGRGEKRRQEIIEATLRVIERDGVAGVTHRSVAREAGIPTASTTYHFATLDDLLIATLIACARDMATEVYWMIDRARSREGLRRSSGSPDSGPSAADEVSALL